MSEIMAHTITLHLLDAPGRVHRFMRKHPELVDRIPKQGAGVLPQPLGRNAEPAEASAARSELAARLRSLRRGEQPRRAPSARSWLSTLGHAGDRRGDALGLRPLARSLSDDAAQRDAAAAAVDRDVDVARRRDASFSAARTRASQRHVGEQRARRSRRGSRRTRGRRSPAALRSAATQLSTERRSVLSTRS